jgi:hypothetical protein
VSPGLAVRTARSAEEVEGLRSVWSSFGAEMANAGIDYQPHARRAPARGNPAARAPRRERGAHGTLVADRVEDVRLPAKLGDKTLWQPRLRALTVSYGGVLGQEDEQTAGAMLGEVRSALRRGEADVAPLRNLRIRSPLHRAARSTGFLARDRLTIPTPHWRARLTGTYEDYVARRSVKTRTALLAGGRAASAMLRRRDQLPRARRLPRRRAEAGR